MQYEMLAVVIMDPQTGTISTRVLWTPEGRKEPPPYTTIFEALADEWVPGDPVYRKETPFLWFRRPYRKPKLPEERDPLGGWDTGAF